jgi:hypothetical protein
MLGIRKTITFPQKELEERLITLQEIFDRYERFEDEIRDVMDFMEHDEHYLALNEALRRLNK